jgi:MFS family permease
VLFGAVTILFGIVTHLMAELVGLGWRLDMSLVFSGHHGYLGVIAASCVVAAIGALVSGPHEDSRGRLRSLISALPFGGEGAGFIATAFVGQFAFFVVSQLGEGCPLRGGYVVAALLAAALTAFGKRRALEFVLSLVWAIRFGASTEVETALLLMLDRPRRQPAARRTRSATVLRRRQLSQLVTAQRRLRAPFSMPV